MVSKLDNYQSTRTPKETFGRRDFHAPRIVYGEPAEGEVSQREEMEKSIENKGWEIFRSGLLPVSPMMMYLNR